MTQRSRGPRSSPGATTGSGRPGSSSARRSARRRRSSAGARSSSARRGLVDWSQAERIAIGRARVGAGRADARRAAGHRAGVRRGDGDDRAPAVAGPRRGAAGRRRAIGRRRTAPAGSGRTSTTFASLIGTLEDELLDQVMPAGGGLGKATMALANRWVTTRQLGFLLGFMGSKVLGQYDLALLSAESDARPPPVRRGEHPPHGAGPGRAAGAVPDLDRAPRDDPRLRVRGPSLAPAVPRGPARAPAAAVQPRGERPGPGRR